MIYGFLHLIFSAQVGIIASTVIDSTPFCIFTVDSILLRIELFRKAPSRAPGPAPETSPTPTPDASAPTADASPLTPIMSPPAPPISSPAGDPEDGPAANSKNSTAACDNLLSLNTDFWACIECGLNTSKWNKANAVNKIPPVLIHRSITRKLAAQIASKQQKPAVEIKKPPIRNETEDCIIIDAKDYKATGYFDMPMFVQHTEAMMEEIDRIDEEIEMEDTEYWSVMDIDSSDKKNKLTVVEYIDDIYAYYKKDKVNMTIPTTYVFMRWFLKASKSDKKLSLLLKALSMCPGSGTQPEMLEIDDFFPSEGSS
ncbi:Cyclin-B2-4 [Capsicum annuum]|uniref:Cyclin-B2-4 n=1 Tax=Capsicum annuum TaxID=4072 RepID=A0A2G2YL06_CAPAN|nr:Cyclin-B2-4 [Capsicum annuum]